MTYQSDKEVDISLPTLYVRDVDRIKQKLGNLREANVKTGELGKCLNPVIRLCRESADSRDGIVGYLIQCNAFANITTDVHKIQDAIGELHKNVPQLELLADKLTQIDPEREGVFQLSRTVCLAKSAYETWAEYECRIDELMVEIYSALADIAEALNVIDLALIRVNPYAVYDYINHSND
ncbi:MAG: hypothetical protein Q4A26_03040 [Candidatus Saccharibacteria bacterium]|nr:hypothetical protein [Candidatus Saccharibacteria bacterium]